MSTVSSTVSSTVIDESFFASGSFFLFSCATRSEGIQSKSFGPRPSDAITCWAVESESIRTPHCPPPELSVAGMEIYLRPRNSAVAFIRIYRHPPSCWPRTCPDSGRSRKTSAIGEETHTRTNRRKENWEQSIRRNFRKKGHGKRARWS